ncbi:CDC48 family AAA ATPase [Salinarchaeum sp. IM2453]|uniref:CDC48 family AAA ATPase n=1 Tax=Salinarchaeum sp. IM2453 TaxID=2862870 RepID=UPI001C83428C|nr:CDC48 family AAA ATPase [Salinarchaeum sp. IM2453]QZA88582.1 CDC48 family AAA ATPase [Salinarchaeum sp. IM2453]
MTDESAVLGLRVQPAEKSDAGRGVARISEAARRELGVLSGDTIVIEGTSETVAQVWPSTSSVDTDVIKVDADTRANAGVSIGDTVKVRPQSVESAKIVSIGVPSALSDVDRGVLRRAIGRVLKSRPISTGEQFTIEQITTEPFEVISTRPDGSVRVTDSTQIKLKITEETSGTDTAAPSTKQTESSSQRVSYEDIGGLDEELEQVREMIELPLQQPELFQKLGVEPPKGVLLYGPPGTGKTLIARAVANEVNASFYTINGPEIISKYKGESEKRLREVFEDASENAPAIIFFDEIDSVAGQRDEESDLENRVVGQLLSLMDGLDPREDIIVIGATNRVDALDPALRRGGRFDREIEIGVPDVEGRREILAVHTRNMPLADDVDVDELASRTHGFVGADMDALTTEAAMEALSRIREDRQAETIVTKRDFDTALARVDPSAMREFVAEAPETSFADVGGLADAKQILRETVEWPLSFTRLFTETETDPPSGVLLYGPPGTGKTLLARALAGETEVNFVHVDGPELVDKYVGESEQAIRDVFDRARQAAPSIIFFDEIDAIVSQRGTGGSDVTERIVSQLLTELDGLQENPNLIVLAATNQKEAIDPAILRPGRIDTHIEIGHPDKQARREILAVHTKGKPLGDDVDLDELAERLEGYTGADIEAISREASMQAIREAAAEYGPAQANEQADEIIIHKEHFDTAIEQVDRSTT